METWVRQDYMIGKKSWLSESRRWIVWNGIVTWRVTHQSQNTRHCVKVITDFVSRVNCLMKMLGIPWDNIANFDKTNIYFMTDYSLMLATKEYCTISIQKRANASREMDMLGVMLTGQKLLPFVIFHWTIQGWMMCKVQGADYPANLIFLVQKGGMDGWGVDYGMGWLCLASFCKFKAWNQISFHWLSMQYHHQLYCRFLHK